MLQMSDVEEDGAADPREELAKLHRKQKKDLQAQIQVPGELFLKGYNIIDIYRSTCIINQIRQNQIMNEIRIRLQSLLNYLF